MSLTTEFPATSRLIEPKELFRLIGDPRLIILDCTAHMTPQPVGPSIVESGLKGFEAGHCPSAQYVDLKTDISEPSEHVAYGLPSTERMAALVKRIGLSDDSIVVLYGTSYPATVTRAFWVLDVYGVQDLRILNGGWAAWKAAGLPVETGPPAARNNGTFSPKPSLELRSTKADMLAGINDSRVQLVNSLSREQFDGTGGAHYGRPGRIPNSVSLPFRETYDADTLRFHPAPELKSVVSAAGIRFDRKLRIYCGGGIAASGLYYVMRLLGHPDISLYDGSLTEWSADPAMPMITSNNSEQD